MRISNGYLSSRSSICLASLTALVALFPGFAVAASTGAGPRQEIIFIDSGVKDAPILINALPQGTEAIMLDARSDGLTQIVSHLTGRSQVDAIHIFSHGAEGQVHLGSATIDTAMVQARSTDLAKLGVALSTQGDLLLYGCEVAGGSGKHFLETLSQATNADVAASTDTTGPKALRANWLLEASIGHIESYLSLQSAALETFSTTLFSGTVNFSTVQGTNLGTIAESGEGGSTSPGGTLLQFFIADDNGVATGGNIYYVNAGDGFEGLATSTNPDMNGFDALVIRTQGGGEFDFNGFTVVDWVGVNGNVLTAEGFKDGISTGTAVSLSLTEFEIKTFTGTNLSNGQFGDVDTIVIRGNWGDGKIYATFDAFVFADAVVPNTAPSLSATGANPTFTEGGSAVDLYSSVTANANDSGQTFSGMTLTVSNVSNGSSEALSIGGTSVALVHSNSGTLTGIGNFSVSVVTNTATVTVTGMTRDNTQMGTLVDGITYRNTHDNPGSSNRVVTITGITDSGSSNNTAAPNRVSTVSVSPVNDSPSLTGLPASLNFTEDVSTALALNLDVNDFADPDSTNITVTFAASSGTFGLASPGGISLSQISGNGTGTVIFGGTLANVNAYLNTPSNVVYHPTANANGAFSLTVTANDGDGSGNVSLGSVTLNITAVNDAPTFTGGGTLSAVLEEASTPAGASITSILGANFSDIDTSDAFAGIAVVANAANSGTQGKWQYSTDSGSSWFDVGTVSTSAGLMLDASSLLRFLPVADYNGTPGALTGHAVDNSSATTFTSGSTRQTFDTTADNATSKVAAAGVAISISVTAINDAPTLTATGLNPSYTENGSAADVFGTVTASTVDSGQTFYAMTLTVTNVSNGANEVLVVGGTDIALVHSNSGTVTGIGSFSVSVSSGTATVSISGMTRDNAQMGTLVDGITYRNASEAPSTSATRVITITGIQDGGGTANGGVDTTSLSIASTVTVVSQNDAPTFLVLSPLSVNQSAGTNATVGTFTTTDVDDSTFTYTLVSGGGDTNNGSFNISGSTLRANNAAALTAGGYSVRVSTTDGGSATFEKNFSLTVVDDVAPSAPTGFSVTPSGSTIALAWTNPVSDFQSVTIRRSTSGFPASTSDGTLVTSGNTGTILNQTSLAEGTYYYAIFARDAAGNFSVAATASATVDTTPPSAPTGFSATPSGTTVALSWTNPVSDFHSVTIRRSTSGFPTSTSDGSAVTSGNTSTSLNDTSLADGTYYYAIFARDAAGNFSIAATASATVDTTPPGAPNLSATKPSATSSTINLSWDVPSDTATFTLQRSLNGGGASTVFTNTAASITSYSDTALADGDYVYSIYALDSAGNISNAGASSTVTVDTTPPAAPNLSAVKPSATSNTINLSWNVPSTTATFTLRRSTTAALTAITDGTLVQANIANSTTSLSQTSLADGTYYYAIFALDSFGNASNAGTASPVTVDATAPAAPTGFSATPSGSTIALSWTNPVSDFDSVTIRRSTSSLPTSISDGSAVTSGNTSTSLNDTSLADGTYYYAIFASDVVGNFSIAATASATVDTTPPGVSNLSATKPSATSNTINLSWDVPSTTATFTLQRSLNGGGASTVFTNTAASVTSYSDTGLADGDYVYSIYALDSVGNISNAGVSSAVTVDTTPPAVPSLLATKPTATGNTIDLSWTVPSTTATFTIRRSTTSTPTSITDGTLVQANIASSTTSLSQTSLADGAYYYAIFALDSFGNASNAGTASAVTVDATAPAAPTGFSATPSGSTIALSWTNPVSDFDSVTIRRSTSSSPTSISDGTAVTSGNTGSSLNQTGLADGTYYYAIFARDTVGNFSTAATTSAKVDIVAPAAPSITAITNDTGASSTDGITSDTTLVLSGTAEANATVIVLRSASQIGTTTANGSGGWSFDYTGTTLAAGSHTFTATATDSAGNTGTASSAFAVMIDTTAPTAPAIVAITNDTGTSATDQITSDTTLALAGSAEGSTTVTVYRNATLIGTVTVNNIGAWYFDYTATTLAAGTHTFTATATDTAGNTGSASSAFLVEIDIATPSAPIITGISNDTGASSTDGITNDATLSFTGTADANMTVTLSRNGIGLIGTTTANGSGAWSFDYTGITLSDGNYLFTAFATDTAGNASTVSADFPVTVDTTAPSITTQPTGGTYVIGDNFSLTVAATDATTLSYQWSLGASTLSNSANRSGVTAATLTHTSISLAGFNGNYTVLLTDLAGNTRTSNVATVVVNKIIATVALGSLTPTYDGSAKSATATTTPSGLTVAFTYDGSATAPTNAGSYAVVGTINDATYQGSSSGTLVIAKASQTISFPAPSPVTVGTAASLSATASSGLGVTYSVVSGNATISGSSFTASDANAITLRATQAGNANFTAATQDVTVTSITKLTQTITFGTLANKLTSDTTVSLSATASSGLTVSFAVQSGPATVSGSTLTLSGLPGSVTVVASQTGNAVYSTAPDVLRTFTINTNYAAPAPDGYATSVTGGAGGSVTVTVLNATDFRTHAESSNTAVITVVGILNLGSTPVAVKSNKTIQGADANATLVGNLTLEAGVTNVIVRGLNLTNPGTTIVSGAYTNGGDAITLTGSSNVFITHCSFFDTADHAIKITNSADNITVSWSEFYYTIAQTVHRYSVLIGNATGEITPLRVTLHHNLWSTGVDQRAPLATFGYVHLYNNYFNFTGNTEVSVASEQAQFLSERNVYQSVAAPLQRRQVNTALPIGRILALGNTYTATTGAAPYAGIDSVFTPGYSYEMLPTTDVATVVTANAGNNTGANFTNAATGSATITGPASALIAGNSLTLTAVPSGTTPASYQWRFNNVAITGATSATYTVASVLESQAGTYTVSIGLATGDLVVSRPFVVTVNPAPATPPPAPAPGGGGGGASSLWFFGLLLLVSTGRLYQQRRSAPTQH